MKLGKRKLILWAVVTIAVGVVLRTVWVASHVERD